MGAILVGIVAALHLLFLVLEMFLWETPFGRKTFGMSAQQAADTAVLAKNQGLYNGILAAGLIWSFFLENPYEVRLFFLWAIVVAGVYGAWTAKPSIFFIQALPALLAIIVLTQYK